jgi:2-oxoglutarate dehydrogenase E1 component
MTQEEADEVQKFVLLSFESNYEASKSYIVSYKNWLSAHWKGFKSPEQMSRIHHMGVNVDTLYHMVWSWEQCLIP